MALSDFFKRIFYITNDDQYNRSYSQSDHSERTNYRNRFWKASEGNPEVNPEDVWTETHENSPNSDGIMNFNVFSDPLEMHRYFERQMDEVMKSFNDFFGHNSNDSLFGFDPNHFFGHDLPALSPNFQDNGTQTVEPSQNLRNHFLKPGYSNSAPNSRKTDADLDGKIQSQDIDDLFKSKTNANQLVPYQSGTIKPFVHSFGQSITSKTIRKPDGTIETHRTVRDSSGNEETTVTKQLGDKQYKVTTRTDSTGKQEKIEDLVNIDEKELPKFTNDWHQNQHPGQQSSISKSEWNKWFPFDKLFK